MQPGFYAYLCRLTDNPELHELIEAEIGNRVTFKLTDAGALVILKKPHGDAWQPGRSVGKEQTKVVQGRPGDVAKFSNN